MTDKHIQLEVSRIQSLLKGALPTMAEERATSLLEEHPKDRDAIFTMCNVWFITGDYQAAANLLETRQTSALVDSEWLFHLTTAYLRSGRREKALHSCDLLIKENPNSESVLLLLADIYERNNMPEECAEILDRMPKSTATPDRINSAYARLSMQRKDYEKAIEYIDIAAAQLDKLPVSEETDNRLTDLWFLKAKAFDRMGAYDDAWESAEKAHAVVPVQANVSLHLEKNKRVMEIMTKDLMASLAHSCESDSEPLLIVGQPRSGTSLMEQILSMHPDIANGGEMSVSGRIQARTQQLLDSFLPWPECMVDLRVEDADVLARYYEEAASQCHDGTKKIVTNKALNLAMYVGMLSLFLPKVRAVMLHRHPLDNCLSCHTTNLRISGHTYTAKLESLAQVWIGRRQLQDHWKEVLDIPIMDLHYEKLVDDQENETRRLIDFLDLPWEERCLEFYKSTRTAATVSYDQVNQKMYKTSSGRWKNYEKHLGPLIDSLKDYL